MNTQTVQPQFQEFDRLKNVSTSNKVETIFQAWNPFVGEQPDLHDVRAEELRVKEQQLSERQQQLDLKEQEINQREKSLEELIQKVNTIANEFESVKKNHWEINAKELADFSIALAEKIVMEKIVEDPTLLVSQIKSALDALRANQTAEIHLCPEDLKELQSTSKESITTLFANKNLSWIGDMRLSRGEIFIDTEQYRFDASVMAAFANMKAALFASNSVSVEEKNSQETDSENK